MKYNVHLSLGYPLKNETIEALSEKEAQEKADIMLVEWIQEILPTITGTARVSLSDRNWLCTVGAYYLVNYKREMRFAQCISSYRNRKYRGRKYYYISTFREILTGETFKIDLKNNYKLTILLCEDGTASDRCNECKAHFLCLTNREGVLSDQGQG